MTGLLLSPVTGHNFLMALNFTALGLTYKFETLYVLYNSETIKKTSLNANIEGIFDVQPSYFSERPFTIADANSSLRTLHEMGGFSANPLMIIIAVHAYDPVLIKANQILLGKKCICVLIILKENYDIRSLETLFQYLFQQQFRRVLVLLTNDGHLYAMKPYPKMEIINVTASSILEYFPSQRIWDLKGYRIQVPVQIDVPNTFWYYDDHYKRIRLDGIGGNLFEGFMKHMNVTMDIYPLYLNNSNHLNINYIQELLLNNSIEISPQLYTTLDRKRLDYSYAYVTTSRCMMLPVEDMKQFVVSHVRIFHWTILFSILILIAFLELAIQLMIRYHPEFRNKRIYHRYYMPGTVAFYMICVLMNIPMPDIKFFNVHNVPLRRYVRTLFCYIIIAFSGFCFAQMYSSSLTSRLTVSQIVKPQTTVEKIMAMKEPIMATEQTRKIFLTDKRFGRYAVRKMIFTSPEIFSINRLNMNMSYIYPSSRERWEIIREQQLLLKRKRFWLSNVCVGTFPLQYQMRLDSPFKPFLRRFIMYICETGLHEHWKTHIFRRAKKFGHLRYFTDDESSLKRCLTCKSFSFTFTDVMLSVYFFGISLSCIAFVLELIFKNMTATQRVRQIVLC